MRLLLDRPDLEVLHYKSKSAAKSPSAKYPHLPEVPVNYPGTVPVCKKNCSSRRKPTTKETYDLCYNISRPFNYNDVPISGSTWCDTGVLLSLRDTGVF